MQVISIKIVSSFSIGWLAGQNVVRWECAAPSDGKVSEKISHSSDKSSRLSVQWAVYIVK